MVDTDGGITTRAIHATARLDAAHAESAGSEEALTTVLICRTRVHTALTALVRANCSMAADFMEPAVDCMEPAADFMGPATRA